MKTAKTAQFRQKSGKWLVLAALACLGMVFPRAGAMAALGDVTDIEPLSKVEFMPEKDFLAATTEVAEIPYEDKTLAFLIRLPKHWKAEVPAPRLKADAPLSKKILGELLRYVSPPRLERRSYFTLEALEQTYEVSARNWLINYLMNNGYTLTSLTEKSEREVEAMYVEIQGDITMAVRVKAFINGPRIVVARYYVPQEDFQGERTLQAQVIDSFKLPNAPPGGIEEWKTQIFLDQSYFDYPVSWKIQAPLIKSIERMRATLYTGKIKNTPDGQINVYMTSRLLKVDLKEEIKTYREKVTSIPGYTLGKRIEVIESPFHKDISWGAVEVYELNTTSATMIPYEFAVAVLQGDDYYYFVTLLTPSRKVDFYLWSRNVRSFRIIVETMRRFNADNDPYYQRLNE